MVKNFKIYIYFFILVICFWLSASPKIVMAVTEVPVCSGGFAYMTGAYYNDTDKIQAEMGNGIHYFVRNTAPTKDGYSQYFYDAPDYVDGWDSVYLIYLNNNDHSKGFLDVNNYRKSDSYKVIICSSSISLHISPTDPNGDEDAGDIVVEPNLDAVTPPVSPSTTEPEEESTPASIAFSAVDLKRTNIDDTRCPQGSTVYTDGILKGVPCAGTLKTLDEALIIIKNVILIFLLPLVGTLFLIILIIGGILYITSRGNQQQLERAKKTLTAAIIGLIIVSLSYTIIVIFANVLGGGLS